MSNLHLLFLLLLLLFKSLCSFVSSHQLSEVGHVLVGLLQQVGQTFVFLLVDEFTVTFFIFGLRRGGGEVREVLQDELKK